MIKDYDRFADQHDGSITRAEAGNNLLTKRVSVDKSGDTDDDEHEECRHQMAKIKDSGLYKRYSSVMCTFCSAKSCARIYCVQCSVGKGEDGELTGGRELVAFCGVGNKRDCHGMELHIQTDGRSDVLAKKQHQQDLADLAAKDASARRRRVTSASRTTR
jgi:hypothetical protein